MPALPREFAVAASKWALVLCGLAAPAFGSDGEENLARLRAMSRDERAKLARKLDEFDGLDRAEREAVRALDSQISALPRNERARYVAVLRRYYVFYQGLTPDQQKAIDAEKNNAEKLTLISRFRKEPRPAPESLKAYADAIQVSSLAPLRLHALARQLIVYFELDPKADAKARAEFARMKDPAARREFTKQAIDARKDRFRGRFREEEAEFLEADHLLKNEPEIQNQIKRVARNQPKEVALELQKLTDEVQKRKRKTAQMPTTEDAAWSLVKKGRVITEKAHEIEVFKVVEGQKVSPENLQRFEAALPPWARESLDPLPPDAARKRLKVLYRLVFPPGLELSAQAVVPEPTKPAAKRAVQAPEGNASPF
jgi:hypothetical protein